MTYTIFITGIFYILVFITMALVSVVVVKNDSLLRKGHVIIEKIFKGAGQVFILINYVLFLPSLTIFSEIERCVNENDVLPGREDYSYVCYHGQHFMVTVFSVFAITALFAIVIYTNFFINSQFPVEEIPFATWDPKARAVQSIWKVVYVFHYNLLDERYLVALRIGALFILLYQLSLMMETPRAYIKSYHWFNLGTLAVNLTIHGYIILQDLIGEDVLFELLPLVILVSLLFAGILITRQNHTHQQMISMDNRLHTHFKRESDMQLYISLMMNELVKLKSLEKGPDHSSTPHIFTIISKHMEHCRNDDCICKKYEPEYDKKFSSIGSRRLTMRQSTSFSSIDYMFKKKIPIKISYETKCAIFMAEISDCIDRFLEEHPASVGLKLQKSFFNHAYMNSSYKALFVQLENSHLCSSFRGKINIYHLKTKIQEEMLQSEASPFSMDITTCLKFESMRVTFEKRIIDLCVVCESFWNELSQNEYDYKVIKIHELLIQISKIIILIKDVYNQLCRLNPQNVDVIQNYALVYRYILRDEFRFNDIVNNLNQLKKTNKLEQTREIVPKFFDSDNYAMILVSGDVKDLGRMIKANRGVERIFGYMPNELQGQKINKIMPRLFAQVHDQFVGSFLKRGHSNFIDRNQFLLVENKMRFIQMTLAYVKVMVDLKQGLLFVSFFKLPLKVPNNGEGNNFIKAKDAHYILCDSKGLIHGLSHNCMKNLGIPPTIISRSKSLHGDSGNLTSIEQFSPNILKPEYEFDLPRGMNFYFDTTSFKSDKYLAKEFNELTGRMRKYNIFVTLKKYEYGLSPNNTHDILLFTLEIISFQLSEAPITIPVDKEEDQSYTQYSGTTVSSVNSDELRTSKFKEFKAQVQELRQPSKISMLRKVSTGFFVLLLAIFALNYALCATQNQSYMQRVQVLEILFALSQKIPSTTRYIRTVVDISNGFEPTSEEVVGDRFKYYMNRIEENAEEFRNLQEEIQTKYRSQLSLDDVQIMLKDVQNDFTIKTIQSTIISSLNLFTSKSLQFSKKNITELRNMNIPFISFDFNNDTQQQQLSQLQQDLYFIVQNGNEAIPKGLIKLNSLSQTKIQKQSDTFMLVSLVIAIVSIVANFIIVPLVYPMLVHYERLAYYILHSLNKLTKKFVENEVKCCNQLFSYIGKKQGSSVTNDNQAANNLMKKPEARKENKQLMRVNPKIPKHLIELEKKKKDKGSINRPKSRKNQNQDGDTMDEEEEKGLMMKVEKLDQEIEMDFDQSDDEFDEDYASKQSRGVKRKIRKDGRVAIRPQIQSNAQQQAQSQGAQTYGQYTASVASIDESTIRTSVEMNSSTNKSSDNHTSNEEDDESMSSSTQSNYTHYTNASQWKMMGGHLSRFGGDQLKSNISMIAYDITHAKSSELAGDHYVEHHRVNENELSEEEREMKRQVRERQRKIRTELQNRKCKKVLYLVLFIIGISIYLGVNTFYTRFVFLYESELQDNINLINDRSLCYPFSLTLMKEMIARNQSIVTNFYDQIILDPEEWESVDRYYLLKCYEYEKQFSNMLLGTSESEGLQSLTQGFLSISQSLGKNEFCDTLYLNGNSTDSYNYHECQVAFNGINNLGLFEVLSYMLREMEMIVMEFQENRFTRQGLISLLRNSSMVEIETLKDIFIDDALAYQRNQIILQIQTFANELFRIFDILFSVFVTICFLMAIFGLYYLIKKMQIQIIQIYHIVLLIPYGERTKRELNELLKINL